MIEHITNLGHPRWTAAAGVITAIVATAFAVSPSIASTPAKCVSGVSPYAMTPAQRKACDVVTYPLTSTTRITSGPAAGATKYVYDTDGGTTTYIVPPASFDAATASPAQLQAYGIPPAPAPSETVAYARWEQMVHNLKFAKAPQAIYSVESVRTSSNAPTLSARPAACPTSAHLPSNSWAATKSRLLPSGAVALRICRYTPGKTRGVALRGSHLLTNSTQIAKDTRILDALPGGHGTIACPVDNGSRVLLLAAYKSGRRASVSFQLSGCLTATNGHVLALANPAGQILAKELTALTP